MAALNELIQKIENPELRAQVQAADKLAKQKKSAVYIQPVRFVFSCRHCDAMLLRKLN